MSELSPQTTRFKIGDRVRYRHAHRDTGTIVKPARSGGDWHVRWDHVRFGKNDTAPAYEANLERLAEEPPQ